MVVEAAINFPAIDPVAFRLGPLAIRWYALAYVGSLLLGWRYVRYLAARRFGQLRPNDTDDLLVWATLGVVLGGRFGYVLFYQLTFYLENPEQVLALWQGGMSFHGGLIGVVLAIWLFARRRKLAPLQVGDAVAVAIPIGLFFGRIANFVNGELFGRTTEVPWAMVFPHGGPLPRHPSQLYEAGLEGLLLFVVLGWLVWRTDAARRPGLLTGMFLIGYGLGRTIGELFREPDAHIGFLSLGLTMGQVLSLPLIVVGIVLVIYARRRPAEEPAA